VALAAPLPQLRRADRRGGGLANVAEAHRRIWTGVVEAVPDGAAALVIGHGGGIEPGLVACLPDADYESWGMPFGHCDGARLGFDDGRFVSVQFRRAPAELLPRSFKTGGR
jgi:broad specificity phosphatase PhoE